MSFLLYKYKYCETLKKCNRHLVDIFKQSGDKICALNLMFFKFHFSLFPVWKINLEWHDGF